MKTIPRDILCSGVIPFGRELRNARLGRGKNSTARHDEGPVGSAILKGSYGSKMPHQSYLVAG